MKRGRKALQKLPRLEGPLPEEYELISRCRGLLQAYPSGEEVPCDQEFVRELLERYVALTINRRLSGAEIAAMVDRETIYHSSISQAIEWVHDSYCDHISIEAVAQYHKRYGRRSGELKAHRAENRSMLENENEVMGAISPEDWIAEWKERRQELEDRMTSIKQKTEESLIHIREAIKYVDEEIALQEQKLDNN